MIFLGSKRYPGEAEFEEFLSENGGESNAYTECEYTCTLARGDFGCQGLSLFEAVFS